MKKTITSLSPIGFVSSHPAEPRAKAKPAAHSSAANSGQQTGQSQSVHSAADAGLPAIPEEGQAPVATHQRSANSGGGGDAPNTSASHSAGQDQGQHICATHARYALIQNIQFRYRLRIFYRESADATAKRLFALCYQLVGGEFDHTKPGQKTAHAAAAKQLADRTLKGDPPIELMALRCDLLLDHYTAMKRQQAEQEKAINKLVEGLPAWAWVEQFKGLGPGGFGEITAHAGDLSRYSGPAKLWKRMGLSVERDKNGSAIAQRRCKDKEAAAAHAFSPRRRAVMYCLGESLLRARRHNPEYGDLYDQHKARKLALGWTKLHAHRHALRVIEKRLLRDLWRAWRSGGAAIRALPPSCGVPPSAAQPYAEGAPA